MKEFWAYTGLRLLMLIATFAVVAAIWILLTGGFNWFYALLISFVISGIASFVLLDRQRAAFAHRVETRANKTLDNMRAKED